MYPLILRLLPLLSLGMLFQACDSDDDPAASSNPLDELTMVADTTLGSHTFACYTTDALGTGDNELTIRILHEGQPLTGASLTLLPMMHMSEMQHSCPVGAMEELADHPGLYRGRVMFIMASGPMGTWDLGLQLDPATGDPVEFAFPAVTVNSTPWQKSFTHVANGDTVGYFISLDGLEHPIVGQNPVTLWVAKRTSMMSFPPVENLTTTLTTLMPSMGHGSNGNVAPVHLAAGRYDGVVGLNMTGDWQLTFTVEDSQLGQIGNAVFTFEF